MGNTSSFILIILSISLFMGIIALGIQSINPASDLLLANKLFGSDNPVIAELDNSSGTYTYSQNGSQFDDLGGSNALVSTSSFIFPDWVGAGWRAITGGFRMFINFVGAPYTILFSLNIDPDLAAMVGAFFGIFSTFIFLNWILGRDT